MARGQAKLAEEAGVERREYMLLAAGILFELRQKRLRPFDL